MRIFRFLTTLVLVSVCLAAAAGEPAEKNKKMTRNKNVALVLSSGGPRGFAYIGAIEELEARGYKITSIAGTSAGSLVGGIYAAGGLEAFKQWLYSLDQRQVLLLMDFSISRNYLVKGEKVMKAIMEKVPDVNIEDLPIPFTAIATDLHTGEEVVFREGPLFEAIRASISIPSMFRPVKLKGRTLIDGGMVNTFPLNRVERIPGDILVGFNVNQIDVEAVGEYLDSKKAFSEGEAQRREEAMALLRDTVSADSKGIIQRMKEGREKGKELLKESVQAGREERQLDAEGRESKLIPVDADDNYFTILQRSFGIMNGTIARMGIENCPPDILVDLPFDSYHGVYGYSHAREIVEKGRALMAEALDKYENKR